MNEDKYRLNPKVGMPVVAGSLVTVAISVARDLGYIDLTPYHGEITLVIMGIVGYMVPS